MRRPALCGRVLAFRFLAPVFLVALAGLAYMPLPVGVRLDGVCVSDEGVRTDGECTGSPVREDELIEGLNRFWLATCLAYSGPCEAVPDECVDLRRDIG